MKEENNKLKNMEEEEDKNKNDELDKFNNDYNNSLNRWLKYSSSDLENKKLEQEKELNDIFKNNNDNEEDMPILKNTYNNLLKDMDNFAKENDDLKDNYNKL